MARRILVVIGALWLAGTPATHARQAEAQAQKLLASAQHKATVDGDLRGAIDDYRKIVAMAGTDPRLAGEALVRMAESYEKLGDSEARPVYERVLRDFAEQGDIAARARNGLARLRAPERLGQAVASRAPAKRLLVDHRREDYGKPTRDGRSYLRYNAGQRAFELFDFATGRVRPLTSDGPTDATVSNASLQLSGDGRRIAATVHVAKPGTNGENPSDIDRAELRVFDVGGRGPGRVLTSWPWDQLIRFSARTFAWSPRDDRIWVKVMFRDQSAEIVSVDLSGRRQTVKRLARHSHSQPPSLSPDGRFITFHDSSDPQSPPDVVIIATDGSAEQRLEHPANDNKPIFTPDGSGIVFESNRRGVRDLWFVRVADGRPVAEPRLVWRDVAPFGQIEGFADNGTLFYYFAGNDYAVYTVPIDLGGGRALIGDRTAMPLVLNEMNTGAAFSPDGRELLFLRGRGRRLAVRDLATGREREIPLGAELGLYASADWCPSGDRVVVSGFEPVVGPVTMMVDLRDGTVRRLPLDNAGAAVCVSAQEIAYLRLDAAGQALSIARRALDTGVESILSTVADSPCSCVRWLARSPDGRQLALILRDPDRSRVVTIPTAGGSVSAPLMTAGAPIDGQVPLIQNVAWMPDGQRLLVVRVDEEFAGAKGQTQRPLWLWEVPLGGGTPRRIGTVPVSTIDGYFAGIFSLTVRPDGRLIAYQGHEGYSEQTWAIENLDQSIAAGLEP